MASRVIGVLLAVCLAFPGLSLAANVKIGVINSMTGPEAPIGENLTNGVTLALEDLKKKGIDVDLVWEDDTGKPEISMSAIEKLATRDKVAGVVGPYTSACANAVAKLAEKYKVPLLIPVASKDEITRQGYKWIFRLMRRPTTTRRSSSTWPLTLGKPKTIAIINENTDFGTSTPSRAKEYAAKKGIRIVADEAYSKGSPDYRSTLAKIKAQESRPRLHGLVCCRCHPADAAVARDRTPAAGVPRRRRRLRHRAVRKGEGHLQQCLLQHPVDRMT